jgi:ABC-type transport system substrate-binding protein
VVLEANPDHWNREARGPRVQRAVFRNDLSPAEALDRCLSGDGEVDIVTEVGPEDAPRVKDSSYARLVTINANRNLSCIINRGRSDVPLRDVNIRKALNMAVDRKKIVDDALHGYATPLAAFTPEWCAGFPAGIAPYPHDPAQARSLWEQGQKNATPWPGGRPLRLAAPTAFVAVAEMLAADIRDALPVDVEVTEVTDDMVGPGTRALFEKKLELPWDLLVHAWFDLSSEAPPAAVHR